MLANLLAVALLQASTTTLASVPEPTPEQWRTAALQDIEAIHDTLRDNAPFMVVARDSADMRHWLETGRTEAIGDLPKITDGRGYYYVLARYVGGFRDGHIRIGLNRGALKGRMPDWPGFAMTWRKGRYEVGWVQRGLEASVPPPGAVLVSCDGQPAEDVARARLDRLFANLNLEAERSAVAFQLLRDYHFPVPAPQACTFRTPEGEKNWKLNWITPSGETVDTAARALIAPSAKFGVEPWGTNAWWIGAPTMTSEEDWKALYAAIDAHRSAILGARAVVIDVRGNSGGSSALGENLARRLYGDEFVTAHAVVWGDLVFKAGRLSRKWAVDGIARAPQDSGWLKSTSAKLEAAPLGSMVRVKTTNERPQSHKKIPNPMKAKVVVLVDHACVSACLDTLDLFTRLPGVKLAGVETGSDSIFMETMSAPLPSGKAMLGFGIKAWVQRQRGSNIPYRPGASFLYPGDLANEPALKHWLGAKLGVKEH